MRVLRTARNGCARARGVTRAGRGGQRVHGSVGRVRVPPAFTASMAGPTGRDHEKMRATERKTPRAPGEHHGPPAQRSRRRGGLWDEADRRHPTPAQEPAVQLPRRVRGRGRGIPSGMNRASIAGVMVLSLVASAARADVLPPGYTGVRLSIHVDAEIPKGKALVLANTFRGADRPPARRDPRRSEWHPARRSDAARGDRRQGRPPDRGREGRARPRPHQAHRRRCHRLRRAVRWRADGARDIADEGDSLDLPGHVQGRRVCGHAPPHGAARTRGQARGFGSAGRGARCPCRRGACRCAAGGSDRERRAGSSAFVAHRRPPATVRLRACTDRRSTGSRRGVGLARGRRGVALDDLAGEAVACALRPAPAPDDAHASCSKPSTPQRGGIEGEEAARGRGQPQPARGEDPHPVALGEERDVAPGRASPGDDPLGARCAT